MPHAVEQDDDDLIQSLIRDGEIPDLGEDAEQEEKSDNAIDFADISDDDLPDEEPSQPPVQPQSTTEQSLNGENDSRPQPDHDTHERDQLFDDLFGSLEQDYADPVSKSDSALTQHRHKPSSDSVAEDDDLPLSPDELPQASSKTSFDDVEEDIDTREQRLLFEQAKKTYDARNRGENPLEDLPPAPQTNDEIFSTIWPTFEADKPLRFGTLIPGKRAYYIAKTPLKPPKPVHPTKVTLELQQDQEKSFRVPGTAIIPRNLRQADAESKGLVMIVDDGPTQEDHDDSDDRVELDDLEEDVAGIKWQDFIALCQNWDIPQMGWDSPTPSEDGDIDLLGDDDLFGENQDIGYTKSTKKRKFDSSHLEPLPVLHAFDLAIEDPEKATAQLARKVQLDLNDPYMLIDIDQPDTSNKRRKIGPTYKRDTAGGLTRDLNRRYNISNDDAYDLLKENHQSKTRSTLGNLAVEHALPALKLQYPFYKVQLSSREARSFHRPNLAPELGRAYFSAPISKKRRNMKLLGPQEAFASAADLSQADNSSALLLEYSEEYPTMLSNFGMGSRLINYYRRKDNEDTARPRMDIGETTVLLPQDRSPFSLFGHVEPGEVTPTVHNGMYRAPVFRHEPNKRDFLVISSKTQVHGRRWYLKNLENVHVVGQEFPAVEVPGTHARKTTEASKRRLKMLSYRMLNRYGKLKNDMILKHLPGSDVAQNRSKMREFMMYDKDRGWLARGETMDEKAIRSLINPEDLCLLESMQVGERHLQDAGYNKDEAEDDLDEDEKDGQSLDQKLAPWQTTKNFLNACQGKAMLALHGEGDPSGRGEAFNLVRTSMKGGFKEIGESIEDRLDAKRRKDLGGHSYNVAAQQKAYADAIKRIWQSQKSSLSSNMEHEDIDMGDADIGIQSPAVARGVTPGSVQGKPRRDDETGSVFSRNSENESGRVLRITRHGKDKYGMDTTTTEVIRDPKVIRAYVRRRQALDLNQLRYAFILFAYWIAG